jgi:large subunit ribosomal protein L25
VHCVVKAASPPLSMVAMKPPWRSTSKKSCCPQLGTGHFFNSIVEVEVGGKKVRTLPKDVAFHPVTDRPLHADFLRLSARIRQGSRRSAGFFINEACLAGPEARRRCSTSCVTSWNWSAMPTRSPTKSQIDVTGLDVGASIHISHVTLPEGSKSAITDRDFTIATIVAPSGLKSEEGDNAKNRGEG